MKKIFILFLFSFSIHAFSQELDYFANNPEWRQTSTCAVPYPCVQTDQYVYYVSGDSTINDVVYKKIFRRGVYEQNWMASTPPLECGASGSNDTFYLLMIQEGKQMYIRAFGSEELVLLYDFDLNVGDALPMTFNNYTSDVLIDSIDSLLVGDVYRKRFHFQGLGASYIIEGIGSNLGLFEPMDIIFDCGHILDCFALDDVTYYPSLNAECELNVSVNEIANDLALSYYPNPVIDKLNFSISEEVNLQNVDVFSIRGEKCKVALQENSIGNYSIDMSELSSGIYLIELRIENGQAARFKVLKK
jgi:hypothetical protein